MAKEIVAIESILNNANDKKKLQGFIEEAVLVKQKIADENDTMKSIKEAAVDTIGLDPKLFNSLVRIAFKGSASETKHDLDQLDSAIEMLFGSSDDE